MAKEYFTEIAQNPKVALGVSVASTSAGAGAMWMKTVSEILSSASVLVGLLVSIVVIIVQICTLIRENRKQREESAIKEREHKIAIIKSELEIEILRQKTKVLDEIDRLSDDDKL